MLLGLAMQGLNPVSFSAPDEMIPDYGVTFRCVNNSVSMCVCVCVCEREREREIGRGRRRQRERRRERQSDRERFLTVRVT